MKINVTLQETEIIDTNFEQSAPCDTDMEIGTIMEGIPPDYEKLDNLPQINGNTLIGDKSTAELGISIVGTYNDEHLTIGLS